MTDPTIAFIEVIQQQRSVLFEELRQNPSGLTWCERHTELCDQLIQHLVHQVAQDKGIEPGFAIVATGGYGRKELSPYSDLDLTIVPLDESAEGLDSMIRSLFQDLHSTFRGALKMEIGYSYRLIADAPGLDSKTRTGLLDRRFLAGDPRPFRLLGRALADTMPVGEFILSKIEERRLAHARYHDTPLVCEPHLKEGAGGQRSFQTSNWIKEAIGERTSQPSNAYDEISLIRNLLHLVSGRKNDLLSRSRQAELGDILGLFPENLMRRCTRASAALFEDYLATKERTLESRFTLNPGVVSIRREARVLPLADGGQAAVGLATATQLGLSVSDLPIPPPAEVDGPAAMYALSTGEKTLRNLDRCALLGGLLPELEVCRYLVPDEPGHDFTIFEHTLRVVRFLDNIPPESFLNEVKASLNDAGQLYLAALLHDVGKAVPDLPHSQGGAILARRLCERWRLPSEASDNIVWLIEEHLSMVRFIRIRDVFNPQTVQDFAELVGTTDRLRLLTLLTWADVNAVSDNAWTQAQDTFLRALYERTVEVLSGSGAPESDPAVYRQRLLRRMTKEVENPEEIAEFIESLPPHYVMSTPIELIRLHRIFAQKAMLGENTIELYPRPEVNATEFTICTKDKPGLLSDILGVFYAFDLSVPGIRACTSASEPAIAIDVFTVSFSDRPVPSATCHHVSGILDQVLSGKSSVAEVMRNKGKNPDRRADILSYTFTPGSPAVLEIRSPRGRGIPYRLSRWIADQGWNIATARMGQWAGNAAAAFYLYTGDRDMPTKEEVESAVQHPQ